MQLMLLLYHYFSLYLIKCFSKLDHTTSWYQSFFADNSLNQTLFQGKHLCKMDSILRLTQITLHI